jgi:hypothetical protein
VAAVAGAVATGNDQQAATGQTVGVLEFQNNYLNHKQQDALLKKLKACTTRSCQDNLIADAKRTSKLQDAALRDCSGDSACVTPKINEITTALNSPTSSALSRYLEQNGLSLTASSLATNSIAISESSQVNAGLWGARPSTTNPAQVNCPGGYSASCYAAYNQMVSTQQINQNQTLFIAATAPLTVTTRTAGAAIGAINGAVSGAISDGWTGAMVGIPMGAGFGFAIPWATNKAGKIVQEITRDTFAASSAMLVANTAGNAVGGAFTTAATNQATGQPVLQGVGSAAVSSAIIANISAESAFAAARVKPLAENISSGVSGAVSAGYTFLMPAPPKVSEKK